MIEYVFVKCNSHRARHKMFDLIGRQLSWFSWDRSGEWYRLDSTSADLALEIKGISKAKKIDDLRKCISFD